MRWTLIISGALFLLTYCGIKQNQINRVYENGIEIIHNYFEPTKIRGESSSLYLEKEFAIDITKKDLIDKGLINIWHFDIDSNNNIYLNSTRPKSIFKFDQNGNFVKAFGKKDEKTDKFLWHESIRISHIDEILTVWGYNTILFFNTDGELIKEVSRDSISEIPTGIPNEKPRDSELVDVFPLRNGNYLIYKSLNYYTIVDHYCPLIICNSAWKELKELDSLKVPGLAQARFEKIKGFFPRFSWSATKRRIYIGNDEHGYEIHVYNLEGQLIRKIKKEYIPVQVTNGYKEKIMNLFKNAPWKEKIYFPNNYPAFQYVFNDDEDRLYVMTYEQSKSADGYVYDVFNDKGVFISRISLGNYGQPTYRIEGGDGPLEVKVKRNRLYCNQMNRDGKNVLVVYKMTWK